MKIHETQHLLPLPGVAMYLLAIGFGLILSVLVVRFLGGPPLWLWWTLLMGVTSLGLGVVVCIPTLIREGRLARKI